MGYDRVALRDRDALYQLVVRWQWQQARLDGLMDAYDVAARAADSGQE